MTNFTKLIIDCIRLIPNNYWIKVLVVENTLWIKSGPIFEHRFYEKEIITFLVDLKNNTFSYNYSL